MIFWIAHASRDIHGHAAGRESTYDIDELVDVGAGEDLSPLPSLLYEPLARITSACLYVHFAMKLIQDQYYGTPHLSLWVMHHRIANMIVFMVEGSVSADAKIYGDFLPFLVMKFYTLTGKSCATEYLIVGFVSGLVYGMVFEHLRPLAVMEVGIMPTTT